MDNAILEQLQKEVEEVMTKAIENSNLLQMLYEKYGIEGKNVIRIDTILELKQLNFSEPTKNQQLKEVLQNTPVLEMTLARTCICPPKVCDW